MKTLNFDGICEFFVRKNIIEESEKKLYTFKQRQRIIIYLDILTALVLGYIFGVVWESMVFLFAYAPLRIYAGGFHATTEIRSYLTFVVLVASVLLIIKFVLWSPVFCLIGLAIGSALIFLLAPVEDKSNPPVHKEKVLFQKRTRDLLLVYILLSMFFLQLGYLVLSVCIVMSLNAIAFMLIMGKLKKSILEKRGIY
jgi:accessory gene regulator B